MSSNEVISGTTTHLNGKYFYMIEQTKQIESIAFCSHIEAKTVQIIKKKRRKYPVTCTMK